ncbi:MAG: hypothetical protein PHC35_04040 [Deltaproteobacteria bacterium]|nr:hypothetical protein [Deltaproteobacteria bacterium]
MKPQLRLVIPLFVAFICLFQLAIPAFAVEIAPRISDREIIEGLAELKAGQKVLEQRIDNLERSVDKRFEMLQAIVIGGFGAILTSMLALVGFILWDRRTFIKPVQQETDELAKSLTEERNQRMALEEELKKVKGVLKEWGQKQPELLNALQSAKIL